MSEKLDGMRAFWDGKGTLWSRAGNQIRAPAFFTAALPAGMELDGELFLGRGRFQECISITRQHAAGEKWRSVRFLVFEAPSVAGAYPARIAAAAAALAASSAAAAAASGAASYASIHASTVCTGLEHLTAELARVEGMGGEGVMLRQPGKPWRSGRTADLLKVKSFNDDEALVVGHEAGAGRHVGRLGALTCRMRNGVLFKVGTGFTDAQRAYSAAPPIGCVITFKFFELTTDKVPRFPTFLRLRPDVGADQFQAAR